MKTGFAAAVLFMLFNSFSTLLSAASMGSITGRIIIQNSTEAVPHAEIVFENSMDKITVQCNEHGYYYGEHIPTGRYEMRVVFNNRTFIMKGVRIYDSYATQVDFGVSRDEKLAQVVEVQRNDFVVSSVNPTGINLANNGNHQATQSLTDVMVLQPGVDVMDGKLYIKGSDDVKFFIDGTPVMGRPVLGRW